MLESKAAVMELSEATRQIGALEQQLQQMQQQQEVLLYTLSHDLRTPVMTILGFTDMLLADLKDSAEEQLARQYLEHIRNSASRQATLIESLLNLSRLSRQGLHPDTVDLTRIAFEYWQEQPDTPEIKRITVKFSATPPVRGDRQMLTTVMHSLLDNAIKFTSKVNTPEISFGAKELDGAMTYFVRDSGVGFNVERAERLFQPFRRLHSSKDYEGLGMGLATSAMIIQRHRGRLWADSAVDGGTTMHFTLGSI
jgi:signal transduction histidine kinase